MSLNKIEHFSKVSMFQRSPINSLNDKLFLGKVKLLIQKNRLMLSYFQLSVESLEKKEGIEGP